MKLLNTQVLGFVLISIIFPLSSFKPVGCQFCVSSIAPNTACFVMSGKTEINNSKPSATYYKYSAWNGTSADCTTTCNTQVTLYNEH